RWTKPAPTPSRSLRWSTRWCSTPARGTASRSMAAISPSSSRGLLLAALLVTGGAAHAHFQLLYSGATALETSRALRFLMLFTHPARGGPHMDMEEPEAFYVLSQRGEDAPLQRTDLREHLRPIEWHGADGTARAYVADLPR